MLNFQAINSRISSLGMWTKETVNNLFMKNRSVVAELGVWGGCYCRGIAPGSSFMVLFCILTDGGVYTNLYMC